MQDDGVAPIIATRQLPRSGFVQWTLSGAPDKVHAERLVHKLVPTNDKQRNAIEVAKRMIWWFYRSLKEYKLAPSPQQAEILRARFDRIFKRGGTGYVMLDRLLRRLFRNKDALLRVLDRPELPLNTNASESDIRAFVTKRKISGGTVSDRGRDALLQEGGLSSDRIYEVAGKAGSEPLLPEDPNASANRRLSILLMREAPPIPAHTGL